MNFSQGHSGTKVLDVNRACFPKEKHQNWFGLPGRLLIFTGINNFQTDSSNCPARRTKPDAYWKRELLPDRAYPAIKSVTFQK